MARARESFQSSGHIYDMWPLESCAYKSGNGEFEIENTVNMTFQMASHYLDKKSE